jgi:CPA2 family monovalent cation:H+ antiporter-2
MVINEVLVLVAAAFIGGFFARFLGFSPVLGYILSGIIFGNLGERFFYPGSSLLFLSNLGIALLLFTLGLELSFENLKIIDKRVIYLSFLQVLLNSLLFIPLFLVFHFNLPTSIFVSVLFSFSSTAIIVKILEEKGLLDDFPGKEVFVFLLIQDILILPFIFFLPLIFSATFDSAMIVNLLSSLARIALVIIFLIFLSRFIVSWVLNILFAYSSNELILLASIFVATVSVYFLQLAGLPLGLAAFFAGILIGEEGKNLAPLAVIKPFRDLFITLFFVLSGMLLNITFVGSHLSLILAIVFCVLLIKLISIFVLLRVAGFFHSAAIFVASYLANIGEFSVIIAQFALSSHFINSDIYNIVLAVFLLSLVATPFIIRFEGFLSFLPPFSSIPKHTFGTEASFENHVVICGHGRVGREVRVLLDFAGIPYIVVDYNRQIARELYKKQKQIIFGDPGDPDVLASAKVEKAKVLVVAVPDRFSQRKIIQNALKLNPQIKIICRSHRDEDIVDLLNYGANAIVMPEFEAGIKIGMHVLEEFGIEDQVIEEFSKKARKLSL